MGSESQDMKAYSIDLRTRIIEAVEIGEGTHEEIAENFQVSEAFLYKLLKQWRETSDLAPLPRGGGQELSIDEENLCLIKQYLAEQPDATLEETCVYLKKKGKVQVSRSTMCRALQKLGLPRKKKPHGLRER